VHTAVCVAVLARGVRRPPRARNDVPSRSPREGAHVIVDGNGVDAAVGTARPPPQVVIGAAARWRQDALGSVPGEESSRRADRALVPSGEVSAS
jgi:hypothetical protein